MIPNGKTMNWHGHHLTFESEDDWCRGCFFADKNECPDCDDGAWVEDNPNPWHTGTPTEEGEYVVWMRFPADCVQEEQGALLANWDREKGFLYDSTLEVSKIGEILFWMPITLYKPGK